jgi:hypothetical protein
MKSHEFATFNVIRLGFYEIFFLVGCFSQAIQRKRNTLVFKTFFEKIGFF